MKRRQIVGCFLMTLAGVLLLAVCWLRQPPKPPVPVRTGLRYSTGIGLIDATGQPISETYDEVGPVVDDYATYREGRYWGLLGPAGVSLQPQFEEVHDPSDARLAMRWEGKWGFTDLDGVEKVPPIYAKVADFSEGEAAFCEGDRWGYLDRDGKVIEAARFAEAGPRHDGFCRVREGETWRFLGLEGTYEKARDFHEGRAAVWRAGAWSFLTRKGNLVGSFEEAGDFSEGRAAVRKGGMWGYIDPQGSFLVDPRFEKAEPFSEGMAAVQTGGEWQYVDVAGHTVCRLPAGWTEPGPFRGGRARATWQGKASYLDRTGRAVWPPAK